MTHFIRHASIVGATAILASAAVLGLAACTPSAGGAAVLTPTSSPTASSDPKTVVAIGDSIPFNSPDDCPGCTAFVDSYADALTESSGQTYAAVNRSRHDGARTADILEEVQSGSLDDVLSTAEVVIVSAGYNDQPPYDAGDCYDETIDLDSPAGAADALVATTAECISARTAASGENLTGVLEGVREVAPNASILVLDAYNAWTGWSEWDALASETEAAASQTIVAALSSWQDVVCAEAAAVKGECVDILTSFNGPDGLTPSGELLAQDYTHPSQAGNDRIRDELLALEG